MPGPRPALARGPVMSDDVVGLCIGDSAADETGKRATAVRFTRRALLGSMMTHPASALSPEGPEKSVV